MNHAFAFPAKAAGPHFTNPWGMKGRVDLVGWLHTRLDDLPAYKQSPAVNYSLSKSSDEHSVKLYAVHTVTPQIDPTLTARE